MHAAPQFRSGMMGCVEEKAPAVLVDMGGVTYIDSSGLAVLIEYLKESGGFGGKFVLFGLRKEVRDVFELVRLDRLFTIVGDEEAALAAVDS